jgi:high-affinity K+ transport system ATPase subunit B
VNVTLAKNPVMFVVEVGALLTTVLMIRTLTAGGTGFGFEFQIAAWLWFTVLLANFAEAMAEGRGKAQAHALRKTKTSGEVKKPAANGKVKIISAALLRKWNCSLSPANQKIYATARSSVSAGSVADGWSRKLVSMRRNSQAMLTCGVVFQIRLPI